MSSLPAVLLSSTRLPAGLFRGPLGMDGGLRNAGAGEHAGRGIITQGSGALRV